MKVGHQFREVRILYGYANLWVFMCTKSMTWKVVPEMLRLFLNIYYALLMIFLASPAFTRIPPSLFCTETGIILWVNEMYVTRRELDIKNGLDDN